MKNLMLIAIVGVVGLAVSVGSAATLTVTLDCRDLSSGEFQVDVYAQVTDPPSGTYGLADMSFDVTTCASTGLADSKEKTGIGGPTGNVVTTWAMPSGFLNIDPLYQDGAGDGDMDAMGAATGDSSGNYTFGVSGPTLVCTQTWIYNGPGLACLCVNVDPISRVWDPGVPDPYKRAFDSIVTSGDCIPEPATMVLLGLGGVLALIRRKR